MKFNAKGIIISGGVGSILGLSLTMGEPKLGGLLLGAVLGVMALYANQMEKEFQSFTE